MDNPKVRVKPSPLGGNGVFAAEVILPGEVIAAFDGPTYDYHYEGWTDDLLNHAIQFERLKFRDSVGIARCINHRCEPNCGIRRLFEIVAMRRIEPGEEITWDYEMAEDSEWWRMQCKCGHPTCRKVIGAYRNMPPQVRAKYKGFISEWLTEGEEESDAA